ncbi:MAG: KTSC domain-containing protein [Rhizobiales bacterium]|nr:KTSC domain-containing protein [Hyphomicrobiales bacterium]MBN9009089.1 KTSC domain-containing protein [Hyphomicrobiales bacterium]
MPSAAIEAFSYDEALSELTIRFVGGATYVYWMVPRAVAAALASAPSRGAFVNAHIKDRFPFRKIAEGEKAPGPAKRRRHGPSPPSLKDRLGASLAEDD